MRKIVIVFFIITSFSSCVYFLYPVTENDADLIFEKQLIGQWQVDTESEKYVVDTTAGSGGLYYDIFYIPNNLTDTTRLTGKIIKIDNELYLDCNLNKEISDQVRDATAYMLLPVHIFYKIRFVDNNTIIISSIIADKIQELSVQKQLNFKTEILQDSSELLILDKSKDLPYKLSQLKKFPEVFQNDTLKRVLN